LVKIAARAKYKGKSEKAKGQSGKVEVMMRGRFLSSSLAPNSAASINHS
jgi:hypothetical protein